MDKNIVVLNEKTSKKQNNTNKGVPIAKKNVKIYYDNNIEKRHIPCQKVIVKGTEVEVDKGKHIDQIQIIYNEDSLEK